MEQKNFDLTIYENAEQSRNKTALTGVFTMNAIIAAAYLLEVIKGSRSILSYLIVFLLAMGPSILGLVSYFKKKHGMSVRYICGIGFMMLYGYIMFTTTTNITFSYVIVILCIFIVYVDLKYSITLGICAFLINLLIIVKNAVTTGLSAEQITEAEVVLACLFLVCLFTVLAIKKVTQINQANIEKAEKEKEYASKLLGTILEVAESFVENVNVATEETSLLSNDIQLTQGAMKQLSKDTNDAAQVIGQQQHSTSAINNYISRVEDATGLIVEELSITEKKLQDSNSVIKELLKQVQVSENSSSLVAKEMTGLKQNAEQMQTVMGLISSIANQTGMLALNASIEAARAGESGRGFAVVATEISSLASQTNNATKDINNLIDSITASISEVAQAVDELLECNKNQNKYIDNTANNFEEINVSTQNIACQANQLKDTVDAVAKENTNVVRNIENVSALTQEVTSSASETLESCNRNLTSISKVSEIMSLLGSEAAKLQQN